MIFITPIPQINLPKPTTYDCAELIKHFDTVISSLESVESRLNEASAEPDTALVILKNQVAQMLVKAKNSRNNLYSIESNATIQNNSGLMA